MLGFTYHEQQTSVVHHPKILEKAAWCVKDMSISGSTAKNSFISKWLKCLSGDPTRLFQVSVVHHPKILEKAAWGPQTGTLAT
jgi:hypothetical protein